MTRAGELQSVLDRWYADDLPGRHPQPESQDDDDKLDDCQAPASVA